MKTPHKHAELIKAWADGAEIEYKWDTDEYWTESINPTWVGDCLYRIKPEPKPDVIKYGRITSSGLCSELTTHKVSFYNVKFLFDGETSKLKVAEVIA